MSEETKEVEVVGEDPGLWTTLTESDDFIQRVLLFYGTSGAGKTKLTGKFNQVGKGLLLLSCDPGNLGGASSIIKQHPKHIRMTSYSQMLQLLPKLTEHARKHFDVVAVDSITYFARLIMEDILFVIGREIPRFDEWNLAQTRLRKVINKICEIPCHIIFTAVDSVIKDKNGNIMGGGPDLPGQLQKELPQACDVVLRLFTTAGYDANGKKAVRYRFQSTPDDVWFAKDRTDTLPVEGDVDFKLFKPMLKLT